MVHPSLPQGTLTGIPLSAYQHHFNSNFPPQPPTTNHQPSYIMVRLKNRYLLLDILYPDPKTWPSITKSTHNSAHSAQLAIHSPTSDALTPGLLAKMIREEVAELYGDWGVGKLGGASATGLNGMFLPLPTTLHSEDEGEKLSRNIIRSLV